MGKVARITIGVVGVFSRNSNRYQASVHEVVVHIELCCLDVFHFDDFDDGFEEVTDEAEEAAEEPAEAEEAPAEEKEEAAEDQEDE